MSSQKPGKILDHEGKLGVLLVGMGAVSTTFMAGVEAVKKGLGKPIGSFTQMGTIRPAGRGSEALKIEEFVPLAGLQDLVFGCWDITDEDAYDAAVRARVLEPQLLAGLESELRSIRAMPAVFDSRYVKRLQGEHVKVGNNKFDLAQQLIDEIQAFQQQHSLQRMVMIWCGSTEIFIQPQEVHQSLEALEEGMRRNDHLIPSSMIYAYAALKLGVPFANGAPNLTVDIPALHELAELNQVPICGKDFKTGQTLMKTILAPGLKARLLGLSGWFSTNILGNRDGEVLDDPESFKTKEESKLSVLEHILEPEVYPDLYDDIYHKVRINYYPPRRDNKEGWDNLDIFGWLGYDMQIKIDFLCRDSILAAPLVLDLALFLDLARRAGEQGTQEWLSFYFKSPMTISANAPEHDIFFQLINLKNHLRELKGLDSVS